MSRNGQTFLVESVGKDGSLIRKVVHGVRNVHAFRAKRKVVDVYKLSPAEYLCKGTKRKTPGFEKLQQKTS